MGADADRLNAATRFDRNIGTLECRLLFRIVLDFVMREM